jgi:hypothetical protein
VERVRLALKVLIWSALIGAGILTVLVLTNPFLVFGVLALGVLAYVLFLIDLRLHPVETDIVRARRSMGRNVPRSWDMEQRDVDRQVELERGSVGGAFVRFLPNAPIVKRSKWARRRR